MYVEKNQNKLIKAPGKQTINYKARGHLLSKGYTYMIELCLCTSKISRIQMLPGLKFSNSITEICQHQTLDEVSQI